MQVAVGKTAGQARLAAAGSLLCRLLHDMKQPLNLIRMVAQEVKRGAKQGRVELDSLPEDMAEIVVEVDRLVTMLDRFGRFAGSGDSAARQAVAVDEVCRAVLQRVPRGGVELVESLAPDLPPAAGDACSLEQAVWELLDNALRATEQVVSPRIELSARLRDTSLVIAVRDNGCGVPPEARGRIFDPFFTTCPGATGLGLTLAAALAGELGGTVRLEDASPAGSVFELDLPVSATSSTGREGVRDG
jgi:C4-dicarboxylate-specific signal transduction histidine kinase